MDTGGRRKTRVFVVVVDLRYVLVGNLYLRGKVCRRVGDVHEAYSLGLTKRLTMRVIEFLNVFFLDRDLRQQAGRRHADERQVYFLGSETKKILSLVVRDLRSSAHQGLEFLSQQLCALFFFKFARGCLVEA